MNLYFKYNRSETGLSSNHRQVNVVVDLKIKTTFKSNDFTFDL